MYPETNAAPGLLVSGQVCDHGPWDCLRVGGLPSNPGCLMASPGGGVGGEDHSSTHLGLLCLPGTQRCCTPSLWTRKGWAGPQGILGTWKPRGFRDLRVGWGREGPDTGSDLKGVISHSQTLWDNCAKGARVVAGGVRMKKTRPLTSRRH